jgi:hypothetical protein
MLTAFVDESMRHRSDEDTWVYALAAVIVDHRGLSVVGDAMEGLRYRKNARVHWRVERRERRPLIIERIASLPLSGAVAVCLHGRAVKAERARRLCIDALLADLSSRGVDQVVIESRGPALDARDRGVLTGLRTAGQVRPVMSVAWSVAGSQPGLWAADCVAGTVSEWLDGDDRHWKRIEHRMTIIDVEAP